MGPVDVSTHDFGWTLSYECVGSKWGELREPQADALNLAYGRVRITVTGWIEQDKAPFRIQSTQPTVLLLGKLNSYHL